MTCIHSAVYVVFTRIVPSETAKQAWDTLTKSFRGNDKTRQMQVLYLKREFELLRMKRTENINEYSYKILSVANKTRLIGKQLSNSRVAEKFLVSLPERFEGKIAYLEFKRYFPNGFVVSH